MRNFALVVISFLAFSCDTETNQELKSITIAELAKATPEFSDFSRSLDTLGLSSTFEEAGDLTVFIPNNNAMGAAVNALGYARLDSVFKYPTAKDSLRNILRYHVLTSRVLSTSLVNNQSVTSLYGQDFTVTIDPIAPADATYPGESNKITLTGSNTVIPTAATVIARDVKCSNGIVHPIDAVLLPATF